MEDVVHKTFGFFHPPLGIHGEGVLEVHHLGIGEPCDVGDGAHHLVVDDIGLHSRHKITAGTPCGARIPVAKLQRLGGEIVAQHILVGCHSGYVAYAYLTTVGLEGRQLLAVDGMVGKGEEVDLMALRQFDNLVVGSEFVAFFQRIGESGENDEDFHIA